MKDKTLSKMLPILCVALAGLLISSLGAAGAQAPDSIVVTLHTPPYQVTAHDDGFDLVQIEGFDRFGAPGNPELPGRVYNIAVPPDVIWKSLTVEILSVETIELPVTYEIAPAPPFATWDGDEQVIDWGENAASIVDGRNIDVYESNAHFPASQVTVVAQSQMRKWHFVRLLFTPAQYNPITKKLRMTKEVEVRVAFERNVAIQAQAELNDIVMDDHAAQILHNYEQARGWYQPDSLPMDTNADADYVIITTNEIVAGSSKLSDFVAHQGARGYTAEVVTEDDYGGLTGQPPNGTAERIRQWLMDNYLTKHIEYVLLIGNPDPDDPSSSSDSIGDVPMKMCWPRRTASTYREAPTDYFYADLTGNWDLDGDTYFGERDDDGSGGVDFTMEVYVGRIPVYTSVSGWETTLDNILQKIMDYDSATDQAWRRAALLPMSFSDSSTDGAYLAEHMKSDYLNDNGYASYTMYQQGPSCSDSTFDSDEPLVDEAVRNHWQNTPYGIITWWAHGSGTSVSIGYSGCWNGTLLSSADTTFLDDSYPAFVYQASCSNGFPESNSNLGYALLKQGAIGTVSASRVSWYRMGTWAPDGPNRSDSANIGYYFMQHIVDRQQAGKALYDVKSSAGLSPWMNLMVFNLYGDPSTRIMGDGRIEVAPTSLKETVDLGDIGATTLTISNTGDGTLEFQFAETEHSVAIYDHSATSDISYWLGGNSNAWSVYQTILETDPEGRFEVAVVTDLSPATLAGFNRLVLPDNAVPDMYLDAVSEWFTLGKRIIAVDSATCYAAYSGFMWPSSAGSNGHGTYWNYSSGSDDQEVLKIDKITEDYSVGDVLSSVGGHAQILSAELPPDALQLTAKQSDHSMIYVSSREVPGKGTIVVLGPYGSTVESDLYALVRDAVEAHADVPWLSEAPPAGTVPIDGAQIVYVIFDASVPEVTQPGDYYATRVIHSNDPDTPRLQVPVTMTVTPPETWGQLEGTVTGLGYCDTSPASLVNADVLIGSSTGTTWTLTTDTSGTYQIWLDETHSPLTVTVTYSDHEVGRATGVIVTAQTTTTQDIDLRWLKPCLDVAPTHMNTALALDRVATQTLTISNTGAGMADFALFEADQGSALAQLQIGSPLHAEGQAHVLREYKGTMAHTAGQGPFPLASGGPDRFGYIYKDSGEAGGPTYQWIEIAPPAGGTGTEITGLTGVDDGYFWPLSLPFSFNFYGTDYTELAIASDGTLYFEDNYLGYSNTSIPVSNSYGVDVFIAHLWDDLHVDPGAVYYQDLGSMLIIEYHQVSGCCLSPDSTAWQVILFANGDILFQYQDVTFGDFRDYGGDATVGIQGGTTTGLQYSYNTPALSDGLAICFAYPGQSPNCAPDVPWLSEDPGTGTLPVDSTQAIDVIFDASVPEVTGLGEYYATLYILSSDPGTPLSQVPVTMTVQCHLFLPLTMK